MLPQHYAKTTGSLCLRMLLLGLATVLLSLGACSPNLSTPTPSPYPTATFRVDQGTSNSIFVMTKGETILVPGAIAGDPTLAVVARYPGATVLEAMASGRRHMFSPPPVIAACGGGRDCAQMAGVTFQVVVESAGDLLQVGGGDAGWRYRVPLGQRLEVSLLNSPNQPPWESLASLDAAVIMPEESSFVTASGIRRIFVARLVGGTAVDACRTSNCRPDQAVLLWSFTVGS